MRDCFEAGQLGMMANERFYLSEVREGKDLHATIWRLSVPEGCSGKEASLPQVLKPAAVKKTERKRFSSPRCGRTG